MKRAKADDPDSEPPPQVERQAGTRIASGVDRALLVAMEELLRSREIAILPLEPETEFEQEDDEEPEVPPSGADATVDPSPEEGA